MKKMKEALHIVLGVFTIMLLIVVCPMTVCAATQTLGDYQYEVSGKEAAIVKYSGTASVVKIPEKVTINGKSYEITKISDGAFQDCTRLTSIEIPKTVESIGNYAFKNCTGLTEVIIKGNIGDCDELSTNSYWSSGYSVFYNAGTAADGITVTFAEGVKKVPAYLFAAYKGVNVIKVVIPDSVTGIGAGAFYNCFNLSEITLGASVKTIGSSAFAYNSFDEITLPDNLATIGKNAFDGCAKLKSIEIPESVESIGNNAFKNCTGLTEVIIKGNVGDCEELSTNSYWSSSYSVFYNAGADTDGITVTFAKDVTQIPAYLFATTVNGAYANITKVVLPETVTSIGAGAFYNCPNLPEINLGTKVKTIGENAFAYNNFDEMSLPDNLKVIGAGAFAYSDFEEIILPDTLTTIGETAFDGCMNLKSIEIPESVESIGNSAFRNCTGLTEVIIKGNVGDCSELSTNSYWSSSYSVFYNAGTDTDGITVTFAKGVTRVPAYLFATKLNAPYANIVKVVLPQTITSIGAGAFYNCPNLPEIKLGTEVKTIEGSAFAYSDLEEIILPNNLVTIGEAAFESCSRLTGIEIPKTVESIGRGAFRNCTGLTEVIIKGNVGDCSSSSTNSYWSSSYSVFYNAGTYTDGMTVTFAEGVTRVPAYLFATYSDTQYAYVTKVVISNTVTSIGDCAFYNCPFLKDILIADGVETFGENILFESHRDLIIKLYDGSKALDYAKENNYNYQVLDWNGWRTRNGLMYWYENGVLQGTEGRGKEIYDPDSNAWFWLDAVLGGAKATSKDLYQESAAGQWAENQETGTGKWVRYDENGYMIKGWYTNENGVYYFDPTYGTMAKGNVVIDGQSYFFDTVTGIRKDIPMNGWYEENGNKYWYENGVRQGYDPNNPDYRGKEIYDPGSDAWYWLDNVDQGKMATSKDVYQESQADDAGNIGKWVRYDAEGHMIKGWSEKDGNTYYFDPTYGTMMKGNVVIDGQSYYFDEATGILK